MKLQDYTIWTGETAAYPQVGTAGPSAVCYLGLGIAGECGEITEHLKKHLRSGKPLDKEELALEIGDVFWYLCRLCAELDLNAETVLDLNKAKLELRKQLGTIKERNDV